MVVIERGPLKGREQEWNISRPELEALVPLGVLTAAQADACVTKEFNPIRCGFHGSGTDPMVTRDILNCGVKPSALLECARANFERKGGVVMERAALAGIDVRPNGALLDVAPAARGLRRKGGSGNGKKSPEDLASAVHGAAGRGLHGVRVPHRPTAAARAKAGRRVPGGGVVRARV